MTPSLPPHAELLPLGAPPQSLEAAIDLRNVLLDWASYDVGNLTEAEFDTLAATTTVEGSILVVHPSGSRGMLGITKHADHARLRAAPGRPVTRFTLSGLGNSDIGAASLARSLADFTGEPVGAIVAGYSVADLWAEGAGGALFFAEVTRPAQTLLQARHLAESIMAEALRDPRLRPAPARHATNAAAETLLRVLGDSDRPLRTLLAHSRGAVTLAFALQRLALMADPDPFARIQETQIVTLGAVQRLPGPLGRARQFLGTLDPFGVLNSRFGVGFEPVAGAGHHLNRALPGALALPDLLARVYPSALPHAA
ncbi:MAG: hypothetical protein AAFW69_00525 [Pseudomonadota bacterium]